MNDPKTRSSETLETDGRTHSLWLETSPGHSTSRKSQKLDRNLQSDVCIVGAGLGGLTTAYLLQQEGKKVCVLEALEIGGGQTGRTTAHFTVALDDRYSELEKYHGSDGSRLAAASHQAALAKVEEIVKKEKIDCDFAKVSGYLFRSPDTDPEILEKELEAAHRAGLHEVALAHVDSPRAFLKGKALEFPQQIQLHPLKYLQALADIIVSRGGEIYTQTSVMSVTGGADAQVKTKEGRVVDCDQIVVATNSPINDIFAIHTKQAPYRSYVLGFEVEKGSVEAALYWDTTDPYHYVRLQSDNMLIVGGEDHKTGQNETPEESFEKLEEWTRKTYPAVGKVAYRWSGQVMEPTDGMAFLGHNPLDKNNVYIITGDSGNGMTHCTIGGMLITDQIMGRKNPWESLYDPSRKSPRAAAEFAKENANVALQYADWLKPHHSPEEVTKLAKDEGIIVREGMKLNAVSRDTAGKLHSVSAICTHLGGIVHWNSVEKTWDCPCHGSRFSPQGTVIEGPAFVSLAKTELSSSIAEPTY
jgi:glycine/D-amino acid oxidase-like deaminating enzyme/nitrite reductase/ring-hydroxylating ferredoxin subunit